MQDHEPPGPLEGEFPTGPQSLEPGLDLTAPRVEGLCLCWSALRGCGRSRMVQPQLCALFFPWAALLPRCLTVAGGTPIPHPQKLLLTPTAVPGSPGLCHPYSRRCHIMPQAARAFLPTSPGFLCILYIPSLHTCTHQHTPLHTPLFTSLRKVSSAAILVWGHLLLPGSPLLQPCLQAPQYSPCTWGSGAFPNLKFNTSFCPFFSREGLCASSTPVPTTRGPTPSAAPGSREQPSCPALLTENWVHLGEKLSDVLY